MKAWGLLIDWTSPVLRTMDASFEAKELRVISKFIENDLLVRRFKPVYWSPVSRTALSDAEIEWRDDHVSTACFISFSLIGSPFDLLVWTTTPWTLLANQAVAYNSDCVYCMAKVLQKRYIMAKDCVPFVSEKLGNVEIMETVNINDLAKLRYLAFDSQPKITKEFDSLAAEFKTGKVLLPAAFVNPREGTGLVHIAPAYGIEDFELWTKHYPESATILECINEDGIFDVKSPIILNGTSIFNEKVIVALGPCVVGSHSHTHRYPYDWRTKTPLIQRITPQWFIDIEKVRPRLLSKIGDVAFSPISGSKLMSKITILITF